MIILKGERSRKPTNLFFIEIIIALLFFSISGAVIMKVFATADNKAHKSALLENVVIAAQSVAELYSVSGDACAAVAEAVGFKGEDLSSVPIEDGRVIMSVSERHEPSAAGELRRLSMVFLRDGAEIYSLDCAAYVSGGDLRE